MIRISSPDSMRPEREYVYRLVFDVFLGVDYRVDYSPMNTQVQIRCDSIALVFPDIFFQSQEKTWLTDQYLAIVDPSADLKTPVWSEVESICGLFLNEQNDSMRNYAISEEGEKWRFTFDLFGSIFFLISRYEEHVDKSRDNHQRYRFESSILATHGLVSRPLVNEYVLFLRETLERVLPTASFKSHRFTQCVTCDVDFLRYPAVSGKFEKILYFLVQTIHGSGLKKSLKGLLSYLKALVGGYRFDLFNKFTEIASRARETNSTVIFYLMSGVKQVSQDGDYRLRNLIDTEILQTIKKYNVEVGMHGGYQSFENGDLLVEEKETLERFFFPNSENKLTASRQHYLRWTPGITAETLEFAELKYDSTLGFAEHVGFRSSCCYEYPVYSLTKRRELSLIERPLMVMDVTLLNPRYMGLASAEDAVREATKVKDQVMKYGGTFTILWHNSSLCTELEKETFLKITETGAD
ncbi:MAG: polysaccharide deacetylase family protein [Acidiferrobacterales bacterium]|nr:polysaccharide deacetylase family protein [Acidiferrobacterales bacterium]